MTVLSWTWRDEQICRWGCPEARRESQAVTVTLRPRDDYVLIRPGGRNGGEWAVNKGSD